jgi:hypothetical protein
MVDFQKPLISEKQTSDDKMYAGMADDLAPSGA